MSSISKLGGKAYNLHRLVSLGQNVPPFFTLDTEIISKSVQADGTFKLSQDERQSVATWLRMQQTAGHLSFIARSSAVDEDGTNSSYAGQFDSFPNLRSLDEVVDAITRCYMSSHNERVAAYRRSAGCTEPIEIAVILQVMVDAEVSGVMFTADPGTGSRRTFLISSTYGACETVVSGLYDCDEFTTDPYGKVLAEKTVTKPRALRFSATDKGLVEQDVEASLQLQSSLTPTQLELLCKMGRRLTEEQRHPVDIEWVIAGGELYLVQMRPITKLRRDGSPQGAFVFDNSNIQESFNGLTLPLTFSFARQAYFSVYSQLMDVMGFAADEVRAHDRRHNQMLGLIKGRVYYNINSWYAGLIFLPSFGRNKKDMEEMMGVEKPVDFVLDHQMDGKTKLRKLPKMLKLLIRLGVSFHRIESLVLDFRQEFERSYQALDRDTLQWMSPLEICSLHDRLKTEVLGNWKAPIINDFYVMTMSGRVKRRLAKVGLEMHLPDLLAGEDLESLAPTKALLELAEAIKGKTSLVSQLKSSTNASEFLTMLKTDKEVEAQLLGFIEKYGDRIIGELKLESRTFRQEPELITPLLKNYVFQNSLSVSDLAQRQHQMRHAAESKVFSEIKTKLGHFALRGFKKDLRAFRQGVRNREAMRLDRTRSFGLFRSLYCTLGDKLFEQGHLESARDVFYLTFDEIDAFYHGQSFTESLMTLVEIRKAQYLAWAEEAPPAHLPCQSPIAGPIESLIVAEDQEVHIENASGRFHGLGCYPGEVQGEIIRLDTPDMGVNVKDKIIVTERTDPGWTPLFIGIKALIVEKGSQLSHSAIVARELGIPTVVSVAGICKQLQTGDLVRLNGGLGTIEKIEDNSDYDHARTTSPVA